MRVYEHKVYNGTLTEATRVDETLEVNSVSWKNTGDKLAVGTTSNGPTEFRLYSFDTSISATLSLLKGINAANNVNTVRYSNNGTYIARGDDSNFTSIYKPLTIRLIEIRVGLKIIQKS